MKKNLLAVLSICTFLAASVNAQETVTNPASSTVAKKYQNNNEESSEIKAKEKALRAEIEKNPACQNILNECKKLGFVAGGFKEGKGLWRNCFAQVIKGKSANLQGKDVAVAANADDISSCKVVAKEIRKEKKELKGKTGEGKKAKATQATSPAPAPSTNQ